MTNDKYLVVVSGPAGVGKDSVVNRLRELHPEIELSVSATSRAIRGNEVEGVNYYYMTREAFEQAVKEDRIVEHTEYCGNYYGTPRSEVDKRLENHKTLILVIEIEGAANIRRLYPGCLSVFLLPPDMPTLEARLRGRGTEDEASVQKRLARARQEIAAADLYTARLVNDDLEECVRRLYQLICDHQK